MRQLGLFYLRCARSLYSFTLRSPVFSTVAWLPGHAVMFRFARVSSVVRVLGYLAHTSVCFSLLPRWCCSRTALLYSIRCLIYDFPSTFIIVAFVVCGFLTSPLLR